jgi:hypothetical protein
MRVVAIRMGKKEIDQGVWLRNTSKYCNDGEDLQDKFKSHRIHSHKATPLRPHKAHFPTFQPLSADLFWGQD